MQRQRFCFVPRAVALAVAVATPACSIDTQRGEVGVYELPAGGSSGQEPPVFFLPMTLRDFKNYDPLDASTNPGFDNEKSEEHVVEARLGADKKPVYRAPDNAIPTFGAQYFDQWYRDVPATNFKVVYPLPMSAVDGWYEYDSQKTGKPDTYQGIERRVFFPLDDGDPYATPFGNQGHTHNQAFTGELHAAFVATAGGGLELRSDDDLYLFIDEALAIDLGGTHAAQVASVRFSDLNLEVGSSYSLDVFYAERQGATGELTLRSDVLLTPVIVR